MPLTTDDARPPYVQLADLIRAEIQSGKYLPGSKLPTYRDLADEHGVAPMTVQSAFRVLKDEGLINSQQGRGSFVRSERLMSSEPEAARSDQDALTRIETALSRLEQRVAALEADHRQ